MTTLKIKAIKYTCDGCGDETIVAEKDDQPLGFHGNVMWHYQTGGHGAEWYACKETCVRAAITNALALD